MQCNKTAPARRLFLPPPQITPFSGAKSDPLVESSPHPLPPRLSALRGEILFRLRVLGETLNQAFCGSIGQLIIFRTQLIPEALRIDRYV